MQRHNATYQYHSRDGLPRRWLFYYHMRGFPCYIVVIQVATKYILFSYVCLYQSTGWNTEGLVTRNVFYPVSVILFIVIRIVDRMVCHPSCLLFSCHHWYKAKQ